MGIKKTSLLAQQEILLNIFLGDYKPSLNYALDMSFKLRVARATNDLIKISEMYRSGLELEIIGSFQNHDGFDGIMLGSQQAGYHLEFTQEKGVEAPNSLSPENLLAFYIPDANDFKRLTEKMVAAGFKKVMAHNPYWDTCGFTFEDPEGYRIVLCERSWNSN